MYMTTKRVVNNDKVFAHQLNFIHGMIGNLSLVRPTLVHSSS